MAESLSNNESKPFLWSSRSFDSTSLFPSDMGSTSAIRLTLPRIIPTIKTNFQLLIEEPHGSHPIPKQCGVWGSWHINGQSWRSLVISGDRQLAQTLDSGLDNLQKCHPDQIADLASHWAHVLSFIYAIGINDARLSLREVTKSIDQLVSHLVILSTPRTDIYPKKYENTATPSSGYASRCQMALNHFDHNKRMMRSPRSGIETFPASWRISPLPAWTRDATTLCDEYVEEIDQASESVGKCRRMVSRVVLYVQHEY